MSGSPAAEYEVTAPLVRQLLDSQFPIYKELPLHLLDSGFDNTMFRLGERLLVRLPRRASAELLIRHEQLWLPRLRPALNIPLPEPLHCGNPEHGYPWTFSVLPWIDGQPADIAYPNPNDVLRLAQFLQRLQAIDVPAPKDAPVNAVRGVALKLRRPAVEERLQRLIDLNAFPAEFGPRLNAIWAQALAAPAAQKTVWLHGDLHARNLLVKNGELAAVIDWGDITTGDAATDLAALWMLFDSADARGEALAYLQADAALIARSKGWALGFGVLLLDTGRVDNPRHAAMGLKTLSALVTEALAS